MAFLKHLRRPLRSSNHSRKLSRRNRDGKHKNQNQKGNSHVDATALTTLKSSSTILTANTLAASSSSMPMTPIHLRSDGGSNDDVEMGLGKAPQNPLAAPCTDGSKTARSDGSGGTAPADSSTEGSSNVSPHRFIVRNLDHDYACLNSSELLSASFDTDSRGRGRSQKQRISASASSIHTDGNLDASDPELGLASRSRSTATHSHASESGRTTEEAFTSKTLPSTPLQDFSFSGPHKYYLNQPDGTQQRDNSQIPKEVLVIGETLACGQLPNNDVYAALEAAQMDNDACKIRIQQLEKHADSLQTYLGRTQVFCETLLTDRKMLADEVQTLEGDRAAHHLYATFLKGCMAFGLLIYVTTGSPSFLGFAAMLYLMTDAFFTYLG